MKRQTHNYGVLKSLHCYLVTLPLTALSALVKKAQEKIKTKMSFFKKRKNNVSGASLDLSSTPKPPSF